ncbi:unnamed protein product [Victoria cruziana]
MKQKLVLQLNMFDEKGRSKAMKTVVGAEGVVSVALDGKDKTKLVVTGEDMDAFVLVSSLRDKKFRVDIESLEEVKSEKKDAAKEEKKFRVDIESLEEVKSEKKDAAKEEKKVEEKKPVVPEWPYIYHPAVPQHLLYQQPVHPAAYYDVHVQPDHSCSIM